MTPAALARRPAVPALRIDGLIAKLQRLLNVDGYDVAPARPPSATSSSWTSPCSAPVRPGVTRGPHGTRQRPAPPRDHRRPPPGHRAPARPRRLRRRPGAVRAGARRRAAGRRRGRRRLQGDPRRVRLGQDLLRPLAPGAGQAGRASPPPRCRSPRPRPRCTGWRRSTAAPWSGSPPPTPSRGPSGRSSTAGSTAWRRRSWPRAGSTPSDAAALAAATEALLEKRLSAISRATPQFALALRGYRRARAEGDAATADGLIAWLAGQPHVGAAAKRAAGVKGEVDHFAALSFLQGLLTVLRDSGYAGLVLVLDEVETLQRVRGDVREKGLNALRQLVDEVDAGRFPGLYLVITGTPAFYDGPQGVRRLEPLAQRLHVDFQTDARFDNPRAVQVRLPGFTHDRLVEVGRTIRDLYARDAAGPRPDPGPGRRRLRRRAGRRRRRRPGRPGRRRPAALPQEAGRRRARPGRPAPRLRPPPALPPDGRRRRADPRRAGRPGRRVGRRRRAGPLTWPPSTGSTRPLQHQVVNALGWRSLRPVQELAIDGGPGRRQPAGPGPDRRGQDRGGLLPADLRGPGRRAGAGWPSLYVSPIKALLNNQQERLERYYGLVGRRAAVWHGDVPASAKRRILEDPPDCLLTTPESLEVMLVSASIRHDRLFADVRAVVVDEVHAFARDDRGWHLLALLAADRPAGGPRPPADRPVGHRGQRGRAARLALGRLRPAPPGHPAPRPSPEPPPEVAARLRRRTWTTPPR